MPLSSSEYGKYLSARAALREVRDGMVLGLGTGSTAEWFVKVLAEWCAVHNASVTGVPTSERTGALAEDLGIGLTTLDAVGRLDVTVDGADEFDPALSLIKGGGGAHLREKIVASASDRMVVISDASKEVARLGAFPLPLEVIPFGRDATRTHIAAALGRHGHHEDAIRLRGGTEAPFRTDEGNHIYDLQLGEISDAVSLAADLADIPGVVEHGLFIDADGHAEILDRAGRRDVVFDDGLDEASFLARNGG
jgi:ribose 5-phosphate isomerase A